jgi:hypothetical protein
VFLFTSLHLFLFLLMFTFLLLSSFFFLLSSSFSSSFPPFLSKMLMPFFLPPIKEQPKRPPPGKKVKTAMNSNTKLYGEVRDLSFSVLGPLLNKKAKHIDEYYKVSSLPPFFLTFLLISSFSLETSRSHHSE